MRAPLSVYPVMPIGPLTPSTKCNHDATPIQPGSSRYCVICHRYGRDGHPLLRRDLRTDPKADKKPDPPPGGGRETRRQRRQRQREVTQSCRDQCA